MGLIEKQKPDHVTITESSECQLKKDAEGIRTCAVHGKPLQQLMTTGDSSPAGLRRINTWKCLESGKTFMEVEGFLLPSGLRSANRNYFNCLSPSRFPDR